MICIITVMLCCCSDLYASLFLYCSERNHLPSVEVYRIVCQFVLFLNRMCYLQFIESSIMINELHPLPLAITPHFLLINHLHLMHKEKQWRI